MAKLDGKKILLRSARADESQMLIDYLKTVTAETRFLMSEPDEINFTKEDEEQFINEHNQSKDALLMLAFVDGEYAGNCSFECKSESRRTKHRAGIGIALFQKYTGFGLGQLILKRLLIRLKTETGRAAGLPLLRWQRAPFPRKMPSCPRRS